ncbi:hypothetical protein [Pseudoalteromonas luteoviolacea]|uniref:Metallo-beta-lactamase domain-containing protein n=1 Tax=Pseudoalteromonas luteoviolacea DSM 6061 TaxID=1365250 RepID=A0A166XJL8_9GAMM|nr:hypothetical protein [Pseudoalteromonas luteoviolacea]KZN40451.1 hypothetical protein N475_11780 [Pseudoalteromonas luteoviolacea DSM 6061]MBE0387320.1 hypothetical protein [Pseudoalteromonas luteoviolacea DSM 6061]
MPHVIPSLLLIALTLFPFSTFANNWHILDKNTILLEPHKEAQYLIPNQALIQGEKCAALIDSHGDFVALELLIAQIRGKLSVPLCYLVATNLDIKQLSGMSLLKSAFPNAQLLIPNNPTTTSASIKSAIDLELEEKLFGFEQSLELSKQRIAQASAEQQLHWHAKLQQAEQRLTRWRAIAPIEFQPLSSNKQLELGNYILNLEIRNGYKGAVLHVYSPKNKALYGGHSLDLLPYIAQPNTIGWQQSLAQLSQRKDIKWVLPGYGKPYKAGQLSLPATFLALINTLPSLQALEQLASRYQLQKVSRERFDAYYQQATKQKIPNKVLNK